VTPSLNFVHYFLVNLYSTQLYDVITRGGSGAGIVHDCPNQCTLTYPEIRYTYDGRDDAIEATRGFFFTASVQQTLKPGTFSYFRLNPELRVYTPLWKFAVLALRAEYGGLFTETGDGASPFTQRFFFGGQNEQRGYAPLGQGPKLGGSPSTCKPTKTQPCNANVAVPIGGKYAVLFSAELRLHADFILNHLGIVAFVDASRVQNDRNVLDGGLEFAPGLGLRYLTAFGPIRLDVAWVANPKIIKTDPVTAGDGTVLVAPTPVSPYCSSIDTRCIYQARWAFHVSLGEAF
jgi:outer membrane protein assembly factor BamA